MAEDPGPPRPVGRVKKAPREPAPEAAMEAVPAVEAKVPAKKAPTPPKKAPARSAAKPAPKAPAAVKAPARKEAPKEAPKPVGGEEREAEKKAAPEVEPKPGGKPAEKPARVAKKTRKAEAPAKKAKKVPKKAEEKEKEEAEEGEEEKEEHVVRAKPELADAIRAALRVRRQIASKRPRFYRQEWFRYKRLGMKWRKPQGGQSKLRRHYGYRINVVSIGYRGPRLSRGLHPSGFREVLIHTVRELDAIDPKLEAARIAATVGGRRRTEIQDAADEK